MNFKLFKEQLSELIFIRDRDDLDELYNDWYIEFKDMPEYENVKEWAEFWFLENKTETHTVFLKNNIQTSFTLNLNELIMFHDFLQIERDEYGLSVEQSELYNKIKYFLEDNKIEL